ncbi:MAG: T9SS type A sorting domain-containing protein [Saprospiraceae bacterium]|nr:T9SS type A sorting domain-containing protein [Saprospiraceae bacterium]
MGERYNLHTKDGGNTWAIQFPPVAKYWTNYSFVDELCGFAIYNDRLFKSNFGGETWEEIHLSSTGNFEKIYFINRNLGWILKEDGNVLITHSGGANWEEYTTKMEGYFQKMYFSDSLNGWVLSWKHQFYKTTDGGKNWNLIQTGFPSDFIDFHFLDSLTGYMVSNSSNLAIRTKDGGRTWKKFNGGPHQTWELAGFDHVYFLNEEKGWIVKKFMTLHSTIDSAQTWRRDTLLKGMYRINDITFTDSINGWIVGDGGLIYKTQDGGGSWHQVGEGSRERLYCIDFSDEINGWAAGENGTILHTKNGGFSWEHQTLQVDSTFRFPYIYDLHAYSDKDCWVIGYNGVFKTNDGGRNWYGSNLDSVYGLRSINMINNLSGWAVGIEGIVYKTEDGGVNWKQIHIGTIENFNFVRFHDSQHGWIGGDNGTVLTTLDGGLSWSYHYIGVPASITFLQVIDHQNAWISALSGRLYKTRDRGETWTEVNPNEGNRPLQGIYFFDENTGWVTSGRGVISYTNDGGASWKEDTIGIRVMYGIHFVNRELGWIVGEYGGIVRYDACITQTNDVEPKNSSDFIIPNPFNGWICLQPETNDWTNITIYDFNGRQIYNSTPLSNAKINTELWPQGTYIWKLNSNDGFKFGKIIKIY